jgi:hypothetical protein
MNNTESGLAVTIRADITALLTEARDKLDSIRGNDDLFRLVNGHTALTAGRCAELAEDIADNAVAAMMLTIRALELEKVLGKIEGAK